MQAHPEAKGGQPGQSAKRRTGHKAQGFKAQGPRTQSVLLLDEEGFLTLRKPGGTLHRAYINTGDIEGTDWVVGTV